MPFNKICPSRELPEINQKVKIYVQDSSIYMNSGEVMDSIKKGWHFATIQENLVYPNWGNNYVWQLSPTEGSHSMSWHLKIKQVLYWLKFEQTLDIIESRFEILDL
jgi:hypothetical protein